MTAALDLAPRPGPLAAGVGEVNATLDRMFTAAGDGVAPAECAGLIGDLEKIGRRVDALKLRIVASGESAAAANPDGFPPTRAPGWPDMRGLDPRLSHPARSGVRNPPRTPPH